ncbi:MAG TPA: hypothetical protein VGT08_19195 [Terracidiphilus sp.]|nr:hypothetical protein [Terracidiphilus sp.]
MSIADSILNRLQKLLVYLVKQDPDGGWGEFVAGCQPVWSRIVAAGHSQGSGHTAYLGRMFKLDKVLMFSGPQDYLNDLGEPAPWQPSPSATPSSSFFAFLSLNDTFNVHHQIANCMVLMGLTKPETQMVKPGKSSTETTKFSSTTSKRTGLMAQLSSHSLKTFGSIWAR